MRRLATALLFSALAAACHHERPGSHTPCDGMTYPPESCPAGETCVLRPGCDPSRGGRDCPSYCVTAEKR